MRFTVYEQSVVRLGSRTDPAHSTIGSFHVDELCRLSENIGTRFLTRGYNAVRFEQFVGVVRLEGLQLEILPKLDSDSPAEAVRSSLVGMLGVAERVNLVTAGTAQLGEESGPFIKALAGLYCRELLKVVRRGLPQDYVLHHEVLPYVRGKVDWVAQARLAVQQRAECSCRFDDRSIDTPLNQTLKQALLVASSFLVDQRSFALVSELRHSMDGVADTPSPGWDGRLDRLNRHLQPLANLARLLLRGVNTDLSGSRPSSEQQYSLLWDMNKLFEAYISAVATRVLEADGVRIEAQSQSNLATDLSTARPAFAIRPDLVGYRRARPVFVADTKWKRIEKGEPNIGVASADAFQLAAYARRYSVSNAVLIFPHHAGLGRCGAQGRYLIRDATSSPLFLTVATIDLTNLSTVGEQLRSICKVGQEILEAVG